MIAKAIESVSAANSGGGGGGMGWVSTLVIVSAFAGVAFYLSRRLSKMEKNHLP